MNEPSGEVNLDIAEAIYRQPDRSATHRSCRLYALFANNRGQFDANQFGEGCQYVRQVTGYTDERTEMQALPAQRV